MTVIKDSMLCCKCKTHRIEKYKNGKYYCLECYKKLEAKK